ncbi:MAG: hypothetical protein Q9161_003302 [Pseudevernia consocians]
MFLTITVPFLISQLETCRDKTGPAFEVIRTHRELRPESSSLIFANENRHLGSSRLYRSLKLGLPYVPTPQETDRDTAATENTKPESSSPSTTIKEDEASTHDLCSSKSISDRRDESDPQSKQDNEDSNTVKVESSSSATKEWEASQALGSKKVSADGSPQAPRGWDQSRQAVWLKCVNE